MILAKNKSFIEKFEFKDVDSFLKSISYGGELYQKVNSSTIFRGHSNAEEYKLVPSALRDNAFSHFGGIDLKTTSTDKNHSQLFNEYSILSSFYRRADNEGLYVPECERIRRQIGQLDINCLQNEVWLPKDMYELAGLAQHYGLPTRLLDWTKDIKVAIYFSISDYLSRKTCGDKLEIWGYNLSANLAYELNLPLRIIQPSYNGNANLSAQKGIFTLWPINKIFQDNGDSKKLVSNIFDNRALDELLEEYLENHNMIDRIKDKNPILYNIQLPSNDIKSLYQYLKDSNYDTRYIFPGYYGVVKSIKDDELINPSVRQLKSRVKVLSYLD